MRHAQSLNEALALGAQYGYVFSPAMRASLVPVADQPTLVDVTLNIHSGPPGSCAQTTEFVLLGILHVLRWLTDDQVQPVVVLLPHAAINSPQVYARYLACDCRFDATFAAVRVRLADLSLQLPARNPLLLQMARAISNTTMARPSPCCRTRSASWCASAWQWAGHASRPCPGPGPASENPAAPPGPGGRAV